MLCTLLDQVHVHTGTLSYPHGLIFGQALWVWPLFTLATMATVGGYPVGAHLAHDPGDILVGTDAARTRDLVASLVLFVIVYASSGLCHAYPRILAVAYVLIFIVRALYLGSRALWLNAFVLALAGVATESLLVTNGWFAYDVQGISPAVPVPIWLAGVYLHAALVARAALRRGLVDASLPFPGAKP